MGRIIEGLKWAQWAPAPDFAKRSRGGSAAARAGLAFQRRVCKALAHFGQTLRVGPWIAYEDAFGPGLAQPDVVLMGPHPTLLEIKLTYTELAIPQLDSLYGPLLTHLLGQLPRRAVLCKHLTGAAQEPRPATECTLADLPTREEAAIPLILYWPGIGRPLPL